MSSHRCIGIAALLLPLLSHHAVAQTRDTALKDVGCVVDLDWPQKPESFTWGAMSGITVDAHDQIYLFNRSQPTVQVYRTDGTLVRSWSTDNPSGTHHIKLDADGNVWLADFRSHVVQKYSPTGKLLLTLGEAGQSGCDESHFAGPTDMAFVPNGDVFISDGYGNRRVVHFDKQGRFVKAWGEEGIEPGQFALPHAIAADSKGLLYVADRNNARIQVFNTKGQLMDVWDETITPWGFSVTKDDKIWVCGSSRVRQPGDDEWVISPPPDQLLVQFDTSGKVLMRVPLRLAAEAPSKRGEVDWIHTVAVDSQGNLYLGDIMGKRAQRFSLGSLRADEAQRPAVIFDTDMGSDCDDAGALAVLHALADADELQILGVIFSSGKNRYGIGTCDAINTYYGRGDLPLGQYQGTDIGDPQNSYTKQVATDTKRFGHDTVDKAPELVAAYCSLLESQPDHSVTICTVGHPHGLVHLLRDPRGETLVRAKVARWVAMGTGGWNFQQMGMSAYCQELLEKWPMPFYISPAGRAIKTGHRLLPGTPETNPVRESYRLWGTGTAITDGRSSWDQVAVLYVTRPELFTLEHTGQVERLSDGKVIWNPAVNKANHHLVKPRLSADEMAEIIEELMARPPTTPRGSGRSR